MKSFRAFIIALFFFTANFAMSQDTLYVYKSGSIAYKSALSTVDSLTFYKVPAATTVTDVDGNVYATVKIGTQTWMAENLKTTKYRNGDIIPNLTLAADWSTTTSGAWCNYDNNATYDAKYGKLYNFYTIKDNRNIAPVGWHVATDAEWTTLINYQISNGGNYDGTIVGNKIAKSLSSTDNVWGPTAVAGSPGFEISKNNSSKFNGLPGGERDNLGAFNNTISWFFCIWTSTANVDYPTSNAIDRSLNGAQPHMASSVWRLQRMGKSIRCIKD